MTACDGCLRRAQLLRRVAPHIERVAVSEPGHRSRELLALGDEQLVRAVGGRRGDEMLSELGAFDSSLLRDVARAAGCWVVCCHSAAYPASLRDLGAAAPATLFGRGPLDVIRRLQPTAAVTVVGARRASAYGRGVADELAHMLARAGLIVVSGLANGIDASSHTGSLDGGGITIAVLGGGADVPYPRRQAGLYRRILGDGGLVLSELPPGSPCFRWSFPARNRVMAALAGMTVVVEAAHRSGSLITAGMALDLGRDVGAVPGPVNAGLSAGANQLLVDGAAPIRDAQDVLDRLVGAGRFAVRELGPELDPGLLLVLEQVEAGHATCDAVALASSLAPHLAATALARLELLGYVTSDHTGRYSRTTLRCPQPGSQSDRADPTGSGSRC